MAREASLFFTVMMVLCRKIVHFLHGERDPILAPFTLYRERNKSEILCPIYILQVKPSAPMPAHLAKPLPSMNPPLHRPLHASLLCLKLAPHWLGSSCSHQQCGWQHGRVEFELEMAHGAAVYGEGRSVNCLRRIESRVTFTGLV
jgi:hypothetical protein